MHLLSRSPIGASAVKLSSPDATTLVTFGALAIFVWFGGPVLGDAFKGLLQGGEAIDPTAVTAVLLNLCLIALGWQRSRALSRERNARSDAEDRASSAAYNDYVTGLLNRRGFVLALEASLNYGPVALVILDLDHFKRINDTYGHAAGDGILHAIADVLRETAPPTAEIARLGGDEFAILLPGAHAAHNAADSLAEDILLRLARPLSAGGVEAQVGASIGLVLSARGTESPSVLMRHGDIAMYEAKKIGRNCTAWFTPLMEEELQSRNQLEADMRVGIAAGQFLPFYQPQVDLAGGKLHGFEVLARWEHPERGLVDPSDFIPVAEATGMIGSLSLAVMKQALTETRDWDPDLLIAINLSPVQLKDPLLAQRITKLLAETGFPARRLELEITESALFDDLDLALATIESLKNQGITISLDDFGTGYSSLTQLQALPFDRIKIDRSFVASMNENEESAAIVGAIMSLGASLHLPVTAEGIESVAIHESLQALGCEQGQGWHFGRPLPASEARTLATTHLSAADIDPEIAALLSKAQAEQADLKDRRDRHRRGKLRRSAA
ncbi:MAG TPA: EAL domain-containing protein [Sphingomonadaceae bacterium]|nr:EAL domain-containing protein [Sphingomonadaceae bacterium]